MVAAVRAQHAGRAVPLLPAAVCHGLRRGMAGQPAACFRNANRKNLIFVRAGLLPQRTQPSRGRHTADLMLTGNAAKEQCNAQFGISIHQKDSLYKLRHPAGRTTSLQFIIITYYACVYQFILNFLRWNHEIFGILCSSPKLADHLLLCRCLTSPTSSPSTRRAGCPHPDESPRQNAASGLSVGGGHCPPSYLYRVFPEKMRRSACLL